MNIDTLVYEDISDDSSMTDYAPNGPIKEILTKSVHSITARAKEVEVLFGGISVTFDKKCSMANLSDIPANQVESLSNFYKDLARIVALSFDAYLFNKPVEHPI